MKKKTGMNICIVRHGYYPEDPRVFKEVRALHERGFSVDVVCLRKDGEKQKEIVDGVYVSRLSHQHRRASLFRYLFEYALSFLKMFFLVTGLFFHRHYKCIQVNTLPDPLVFLTIFPRMLGTKVLLDMHEPTPELFITKYGEGKFRFIYKMIVLMEQASIRYANQVLTVNEALRKKFIERGANGQKIHVVRNVPDEAFHMNKTERGSDRGFELITHGTIVERYGQGVIIRALPILRDKIGELHLSIVGDGENTEQVRSLVNELGCSDMVTFTGRVPFSRIGEYISAANVGIVPLLQSPFSDLCQPNKLFEYIAYKKPVVVSHLEAIEESFDDSCVMFFEPGDHEDLARCVIELYANPGKQHELVENAYERYEEIRWGKTKEIYLKVIENLMRS